MRVSRCGHEWEPDEFAASEEAALYLRALQMCSGDPPAHKLLPAAIDVVLSTTAEMKKVAKKVRKVRSALFLGRYVNFPTALEGRAQAQRDQPRTRRGRNEARPDRAARRQRPRSSASSPRGACAKRILSNIAEHKAREASIVLVHKCMETSR